jgi:hypothetical protein
VGLCAVLSCRSRDATGVPVPARRLLSILPYLELKSADWDLEVARLQSERKVADAIELTGTRRLGWLSQVSWMLQYRRDFFCKALSLYLSSPHW